MTMEQRRLGTTGVWVSERQPQPPWQLPPLDHPRGRALAGPARHRLDRPLPDPPLGPQTDLDLPDNQRKLEAADQLAQLADDAGITLIELAIAFVVRHPAVTSAIIGPRTMEHLESQLTATDVHLADDVLDRIDQIVAPGVTLNPADNGWVSPALDPTARRR